MDASATPGTFISSVDTKTLVPQDSEATVHLIGSDRNDFPYFNPTRIICPVMSKGSNCPDICIAGQKWMHANLEKNLSPKNITDLPAVSDQEANQYAWNSQKTSPNAASIHQLKDPTGLETTVLHDLINHPAGGRARQVNRFLAAHEPIRTAPTAGGGGNPKPGTSYRPR